MPSLSPKQRKTLEKTVIRARRLAENGAANALKALAVNHHEPFAHMDPPARALRNLLRSKGRLLGDKKRENGQQEIVHLAYELAYEYWHKILFARFLEANHLLIHPGHDMAVTLEECEELAPEEGYADKWEAATAYASHMLPAIFRPDDPLVQIRFATEDRIALENILDALEPEIFTADDSLGWTYQFWQTEAKDAINKSGDKIDGARLPAVTQLFTEPYMVHFLIDNTLGAWWVSRHPGDEPPVDFAYLRKLEDGTPAAGRYAGWPDTTAEVTVLDPCMGSGHFVATLFPILAALRMQEEGISKAEATEKVVTENLHGLELDPRCTQIAAFNLALTAWKFNGEYLELPPMNLACSGLAPRGKPSDWAKLGGDDPNLRQGMSMLFQLFRQAPELGSLIDPGAVLNDHLAPRPEKLIPVLEKAIADEQNAAEQQRGVVALGIASAAKLLSQKYFLQITNVPYLKRGSMDRDMREFASEQYPKSKGDLATIFLDRLQKTMEKGGIATSVMPQNWLFLTTYKKFRQELLKARTWNFVARLGPGAFREISGEVVKAILVSLQNQKPDEKAQFMGIDVADLGSAEEKDAGLRSEDIVQVDQARQLENPDARVVLGEMKNNIPLLNTRAFSWQGIKTSDDNRFCQEFWEQKVVREGWLYYQRASKETNFYSGRNEILFWEDGKGKLTEVCQKGASFRGKSAWEKLGIGLSMMGRMPATIYTGDKFSADISIIQPNDQKDILSLWAYCTSSLFENEIRKIDQALKVTNTTLVKVPFDLEHWQKVAAEKYPDGLPEPYSDDPTQWLFHGHPRSSEAPLQVALARLLGYRWPAESDPEMELAQEARDKIAVIQAFDQLSDADGIVCIPSVNGEAPAANRLRDYLAAVWGEAWTHQTLDRLLEGAGSKKKDLEQWLRDQFFQHHCKLFKNRPFIWHVWDGRKDGFSALLNYHKLDKKNLQTLIYTYLGDWIRQCEAKVKRDESGAEGLLMAANELKEKLELILAGAPPYDIFVRWKTLAEQPLGWDPDLNDGVRLNVRPFVEAGILRRKFNVKWGVDRGKNPPGSPWGEKRDNGRHLTLEEKRKARAERKEANEAANS